MGIVSDETNNRIAENSKVRTTALLIDWIFGFCVARIEMSHGGRGQMPAGRETHDSDSVRINPEVAGVGTHHSQRSLSVLERNRVAIRAEPITKHKGRYANSVEVSRWLNTFMVRRMNRVSAARANDDRCTVWIVGGRINPDARLIPIFVSHGSGSTIGPQQPKLRLFG